MVELRDSSGRHWQITIGNPEATCDDEIIENEHTFEIDARPNRLWVDGQLAHVVKVQDDWWIHINGCIHVLSIDEKGASGSSGDDGMAAPMPGKILEILCSVGDQVENGQTLIVMEAMKMAQTVDDSEKVNNVLQKFNWMLSLGAMTSWGGKESAGRAAQVVQPILISQIRNGKLYAIGNPIVPIP